MSFVASILNGTIGTTINAIGNVVGKFVTTSEEKMQLQIDLEQILQRRDSEVEATIRSELDAKSKIIMAEMGQDDKYTKRARPTVVYVGLLLIFFNGMSWFELPTEFWYAWGGLVSTWVVGRSAEKRGIRNKVTDFITGSKSSVISKMLG